MTNSTEPTLTAHDLRATWDRYSQAWRDATPEAKAASLTASVDPTCVYRDPLMRADGHGALIDYMLQFHQQIPGGYFETTYFLTHHARSVARWNMRDGHGAVLGDGVSFGEYDARGRLIAMTGFFEPPAPSGA